MDTQPVKVRPEVAAVLRYIGVARGGLSARVVADRLLSQAIERDPLGGEMMALVARSHKGPKAREGGKG
jgi:hypothetical protein